MQQFPERYSDILLTLDQRIARLSAATGIDLADETNVSHLLARDFAPFSGVLPRFLEELRGLLVLRYVQLRHCADELGAPMCAEMLGTIEAQMQQGLFEPGEESVDFHSLLDKLREVIPR